MEELKITENQALSSKLFGSKEFFPLIVQADNMEAIRFDKRLRKTESDIIDVYVNDLHIGMFIGIKKVANTLFFGPCDLNTSHHYRGILNYGFIRLLEYYGLDGVEKVVIEKPEVAEFVDFLKSIGFILSGKILQLDLSEGADTFMQSLESNFPKIVDRTGQIMNVIMKNMANPNEKEAKKIAEEIILKVKNRDRMGSKFWNWRSVVNFKSMLNTAILHESKGIYHNYLASNKLLEERLINEEFVNFFLKSLINSFEVYIRGAYLEEMFNAIDEKSIFPIPYVQDIIEKMKTFMSEEIKDLNREKLRNWISHSIPLWEMREKMANEQEEKIRAQSKIEISDFAPVVNESIKPMVKSLVDHYNNNRIFFGVENCFK